MIASSAPPGRERALFTALGLEWDPQFLELPRAAGAVKAASVWQVREPLYRRASGRARHYAQEVAPLRASLSDLLPAGEE